MFSLLLSQLNLVHIGPGVVNLMNSLVQYTGQASIDHNDY